MNASIQQARSLLLAVCELHRRGYARIRIIPRLADSPGGTVWQCEIVPADWIARDHGATLQGSDEDEVRTGSFFYSTRAARAWSKRQPFASGSIETIADWLLTECEALRDRGFGVDPEYAAWLARTIELTEPEGLLFLNEVDDAGMSVLNGVQDASLPNPPRVPP